jgi:hypothetical protein
MICSLADAHLKFFEMLKFRSVTIPILGRSLAWNLVTKSILTRASFG